jgi:hypothetical protein
MKFGMWTKMFETVIIKSVFDYVHFYDVKEIQTKYKFTNELMHMAKTSNGSDEAIWLYFKAITDDTLLSIYVDINYKTKNYQTHSTLLHCDESQRFGHQRLLMNVPDRAISQILKSETEDFLKTVSDERLKLLLGWKIG